MPVFPVMRLEADEAPHMLNGGLLGVDMYQMGNAGPNRPRLFPLVKAGRLRYSRRDPAEHWQTYRDLIGAIQRRGVAFADCEDLSCALAAEMRVDGIDPNARPVVYRSAGRTYHVVVWSPRYGYLDPSVAAGMGWRNE